MSVTSRSGRLALAAVVALVALAVRFAAWEEIRGTPLDAWHEWGETDMATYLEQARRLAGGGWLAPEPYHPYHAWQSVAPPERWVGWYGPGVFHQAPLYSYALALALRGGGDPLARAKALQLALGAASALLAFAIALRLAGPIAATTAGLLIALHGPLVALEAQLLREGPAIFGLLAVLALLVRHLGPPLRGPGSAALLGAALGAFAMLHELARVAAILQGTEEADNVSFYL